MIKRLKSIFAPREKRRAARNERNMKRWMRTFTPQGRKQIQLTRVYTTREGVNFYVYTDPMDMPVVRKQQMDEAITAASRVLSKEEILQYLTDVDSFIQSSMGQFNANRAVKFMNKMHAKTRDFIHRINNLDATTPMIVEIAICIFVMDGENPYTANPESMNRKREMLSEDDDLKAFFLRSTTRFLTTSLLQQKQNSPS